MTKQNRLRLTYLGFLICGIGLISSTSIFVTNKNAKYHWFSLITGVIGTSLCGYLYKSERKISQQVEPQDIEIKIVPSAPRL